MTNGSPPLLDWSRMPGDRDTQIADCPAEGLRFFRARRMEVDGRRTRHLDGVVRPLIAVYDDDPLYITGSWRHTPGGPIDEPSWLLHGVITDEPLESWLSRKLAPEMEDV